MKKVIITGINDGLGYELFEILSQNDCIEIIGIDIKKSNLKKMRESNCNFRFIHGDIASEKVSKRLFKLLNNHRYDSILLINNAAFSCVEEPYNLEMIDKIIGTNLIGSIKISSVVLSFSKDTTISIVNILSKVAYEANRNAIYAASKWGLRGYSMGLSNRYINEDIKFINIVPHSMNTSYWDNKPIFYEQKSSFESPKFVAKKMLELLNKCNDKFSEIFIPYEGDCENDE